MKIETFNRFVSFAAPYHVEVKREKRPAPPAGQVLVKTRLSAISPGTEMLVYRGQLPKDIPLDASIAALQQTNGYPMKYGYACIGQVIALGAGVPAEWLERMVFAFNPHEAYFVARLQDVLPIPDGLPLEDAVFLPNMETAINLVQDGAPLLGERVAIFGQGIVGLLTAALLAYFPLERLVTFDRYPRRRQASLEVGAHASLDAERAHFEPILPGGADLTFELSGAPAVLDAAIAATGFAGRIVIGSWYGEKRAALNFGGAFHRSRIRILSSQVSTIAPQLTGRWDKSRRFALAWEMLRQIRPARWVTHRFEIGEAARAYAQIDQCPEDTLQVLLTYMPEGG
ncbi:MAG: zinc-binding alcohol dehydrogenase [Anaerolineales bacterium]